MTNKHKIIFILIILAVIFMLPHIAWAKKETKNNLSFLTQMEENIVVLEKGLEKIKKTNDPELKKKLYKDHYQALTKHMNMMEKALDNDRNLGLKRNKNRMKARIKEILKIFNKTLKHIKAQQSGV